MSHRRTVLPLVPSLLAALAAFASGSFAQSPRQIGTTGVQSEPNFEKVVRLPEKAPYDALTDNLSEVVNFHPEPYRGIDVDVSGRVWAVNTYGSTLVRYAPMNSTPQLIAPTGLNPVSVAVVEQGGHLDVLVACVGTHALFVHDGDDGHLKGLIKLDSEPGDIEVDLENGWAFISCQGSNTICQVDLSTFSIIQRYVLPGGERPGPLYLDLGQDGNPADNRVLVAATVTGNNSVPRGSGPNGTVGRIRDLDLFPCCELPDEDLHRIDPFAQTIEPAATKLGSMIFDIGRNPTTGDLWVLSSDSNNKDDTLDTEAKVKGKVVINQLKIVPGVGSVGTVAGANGIDLDDYDPSASGPQYDPARSINQARTMAFLNEPTDEEASAFVASGVTDLILVLDRNGNRIDELQLPDGAQCFSLRVTDEDAGRLHALCLGTRSVEVFQIDPLLPDPIASLDLGLDPTPGQIRRGRDLFMDGSRSEDSRSGCFSCHPGGRADQLGWQIRGDPLDEKDVMVTQSLLSIHDTFPYHWRGERALVDFRKAFRGLLGASAANDPTDQEMADFVVFMQSLQAPANPLQNPLRILDATINPVAPNGMSGSPVRGQHSFNNIVNFNQSTCVECHPLISGSDGNMFPEEGSPSPRAAQIEVAHLRQLQHKGLETLELDFGNGPQLHNVNGFGAAHDGDIPSVFNFIFDIPVFGTMNDQQRVDTFKFVEQFDQGISAACHWASYYDENSPSRVPEQIEMILLDGAGNGWNDVAVFGRRDAGAGLEPTRWYYDAETGLFVPEATDGAEISWAQMRTEIEAGAAEYAFIGLPPGNGRRFAIDFDNDGLPNADEIELGVDPWRRDSDGDGDADGYEVANGGNPAHALFAAIDLTPPELVGEPELEFSTARVAKYLARFSEEVTYEVSYRTAGGPERTFERKYFTRADTIVLTHSEPSTPTFEPIDFTAEITLTDRAGNTAGPFPLTGFTPREAALMQAPFPPNTQITEMEYLSDVRNGTTLEADLRVRVNYVYGAPDYIPTPQRMVFCTVAVLDQATNTWVKKEDIVSHSGPTTFEILLLNGVVQDYNFDPGPPWLVSPMTNDVGDTTISFDVNGLTTGDRIRVAVMGIAEAVPEEDIDADIAQGLGGEPVYDGISFFQMQPLLTENSSVIEITF